MNPSVAQMDMWKSFRSLESLLDAVGLHWLILWIKGADRTRDGGRQGSDMFGQRDSS